MSCPMTSAIDSLCQTAPHIILFEPPSQPHYSRKDLYKKMLASERRILEQNSKKHTHNALPYTVAKRACRWYRRCCTKNLDPEEWEALELMESAREHGLAAAYNVNASTGRLKEKKGKKNGGEVVRVSMETVEMKEGRKCSVVTVQTREVGSGDDEDDGDDGIAPVGQVRKGSMTVTTTTIIPPSSSASSTSTSTSEASTLPTSVRSSTDTMRYYGRPSLTLSIDSCEECHQVDTAEERKGLLVKWAHVEGEQMEMPGRKWWTRLSLRRGPSFRGL